MKPNQLARFAALVLALAGVAALVASAVVSLRSFHTQVLTRDGMRRYDCGSVLSAKDPRDLILRSRRVPPALSKANKKCEDLRSDRTNKALTFMIAGAVPLLVVLALPFLSRRARRSSRRRRLRM